MKTIATALPILLVLTAAGCGDESSGDAAAGDTKVATADTKAPAPAPKADPAPPLDPRVAKAAEIARAIDKDPAKADEVLASKGMDRDALEALMYEIAKDPKLSASYEQARAGR